MRGWEIGGYVGILIYNTEVMKLYCNFSWVIVKDFSVDFSRADKNLNE